MSETDAPARARRWISNAIPGTHAYYDRLRESPGHVQGEPMGTARYTAQQLSAMGFVGIWAEGDIDQ